MPSIYHCVFIAAPALKVYDALTLQEALAAWWTSHTFAQPSVNTIAKFGFGLGYFKEMRIAELIPGRSVKWECITGASEWVGTSLSFILTSGHQYDWAEEHPEISDQLYQSVPGRETTLLTFEHSGWDAVTPMFAECNYTWGRFLRSLKLYCETGKGTPWPHQHTVNFSE